MNESLIKLRKIAHARSGDKGSSANIAVFANTREGYQFLRDQLTPKLVEDYFKPLGVGALWQDKVEDERCEIGEHSSYKCRRALMVY